MKRIILILVLFVFTNSYSFSDDNDVYKGISEFTRVLDIVQRNYVEDVDPNDLTENAIDGMLKALDPYSTYLTPERYKELEIGTSGEFGGVGLELTVQDDTLTVIAPIDGTPADLAGIKSGDKIIKINGKTTKDVDIHEAVKLLRGPKGSTVVVTIRNKSDNRERDVTLTRDLIQLQSIQTKLLDGGILYIRLSQFQENTYDDLIKSFNELENRNKLNGVVLDLRNNPGGLLEEAVQVADEFLDEGLVVSVKGRSPDQSRDYYSSNNGLMLDHPLIVLVNNGSASASEIVAEALQDRERGIIIGTKTFGKGSVQTIIELEDGAGLKLTTAKFYAPSGRSINEVGVTPDIQVDNNDSKDIQLERALELLRISKVSKM